MKFNPGPMSVLADVDSERRIETSRLAEVKMELRIENSLTNKLLVQKEIYVSMPVSKIPFRLDDGRKEFDETVMNKSAMGKALKKLAAISIGLVESTLKTVPFEAVVIAIDR